MKTAELVVDITIVGFLALLWISGFTFSYILEPSIAKDILVSSSATTVLIILLIVYSLGIVFDYINAAIFSIFKSKKEQELYKDFSIVRILAKNDKLYPFIENYYGRLRILRSIIISIPLLTWSVSCFIFFNHSGLKISITLMLIIIVLSGISLFILSIISYKRRNKDYQKYILDLKSLFPLDINA